MFEFGRVCVTSRYECSVSQKKNVKDPSCFFTLQMSVAFLYMFCYKLFGDLKSAVPKNLCLTFYFVYLDL